MTGCQREPWLFYMGFLIYWNVLIEQVIQSQQKTERVNKTHHGIRTVSHKPLILSPLCQLLSVICFVWFPEIICVCIKVINLRAFFFKKQTRIRHTMLPFAFACHRGHPTVQVFVYLFPAFHSLVTVKISHTLLIDISIWICLVLTATNDGK